MPPKTPQQRIAGYHGKSRQGANGFTYSCLQPGAVAVRARAALQLLPLVAVVQAGFLAFLFLLPVSLTLFGSGPVQVERVQHQAPTARRALSPMYLSKPIPRPQTLSLLRQVEAVERVSQPQPQAQRAQSERPQVRLFKVWGFGSQWQDKLALLALLLRTAR